MSNAISQSLPNNQEPPKYSDEFSEYMRVPSYREGDANFVTNDSAVLFMSEGQVLDDIKKFLLHACPQTPKITIDGKNYGGNHIVRPDAKDFAEKLQEIIKT